METWIIHLQRRPVHCFLDYYRHFDYFLTPALCIIIRVLGTDCLRVILYIMTIGIGQLLFWYWPVIVLVLTRYCVGIDEVLYWY